MRLDCPICKGSGVLPENMVYDRDKGEAMKETRREPYVTMRDRSREMGISVVDLSRMERGFFTKEEYEAPK